jgi:hypothetical protein
MEGSDTCTIVSVGFQVFRRVTMWCDCVCDDVCTHARMLLQSGSSSGHTYNLQHLSSQHWHQQLEQRRWSQTVAAVQQRSGRAGYVGGSMMVP